MLNGVCGSIFGFPNLVMLIIVRNVCCRFSEYNVEYYSEVVKYKSFLFGHKASGASDDMMNVCLMIKVSKISVS